MPAILSIGDAFPPVVLHQEEVMQFSQQLFNQSFPDINRLLHVFPHGQVEKRHFVKDLDWYQHNHPFVEKNNAFIESAIDLGSRAISNCLHNHEYLKRQVAYEEIEAIFLITSTGIATPSIEARIMNVLPFSEKTKRIPIWGLGCAGGAAGLSRAFEYCKAYPKAKVLVLAIELCSLTFQPNDLSKSNLIGTSLFGDGVVCVLVSGDEVEAESICSLESIPKILATQSTTMRNSLDVMGWEVKNDGLYVVFSKDIPVIVEKWLKPIVGEFLHEHQLSMERINHFIAHPGGKKVLDAYVKTLQLDSSMIEISFNVLRNYGNISSATVLLVLKGFLQKAISGEWGLCTALGPGFSSELLLVRWD
ncbi:type III polyketide synthase [Niallia endozanthoxylica]|uniref:Type III polyketide synthase n=1 Tax=Niallia endozanthoxylica TaxID=2036016 RepID=A0A5J5HUM4_9BACI|nr:3-oxoacyl-[acyl-carrier-protein] synthase III C-terminal domain-containing protein [Niallia endozanthoxylica]KAA9026075.1 type III polyketide synthase [Niallia endozanthoxylica]